MTSSNSPEIQETAKESNPDLEIAHQKGYNVTCCRSYRSPKGRCYSCPEEDYTTEKDIDEEEL